MVTVQGARPGSREDSRGGEGSDQKSRPKAGRGKANKGWSPPKDVSAVKRSADVPELSAQSGPQFEDSTVFEIVVPSEASSLEAAQLEMRLLTAVHRNKAAEFAEHLFESGRMRRANREQVVADLTMVVDESLNNMITHGMILSLIHI